mgnify:CR=1 FL=1
MYNAYIIIMIYNVCIKNYNNASTCSLNLSLEYSYIVKYSKVICK